MHPPLRASARLAELPAYKNSDAIVVTDKEATSYAFGIYYPAYKVTPSLTLDDYRDDLEQQLFTTLLNQRLQELTQKENPPFLFASTDFSSFARGYEGFSAFGGAGTGDVNKGMNALAEEIERAKRYGFTAGELERAKKNMLALYEREYKNRDKTESENYVEEYISHFLEQQPSPGIEKEYEFVQQLLPGITIDEVNAIAKKFKDQTNRFVFVLGPDPKPNEKLPEAKELLAMVDAKSTADIKPYEEKVVQTNLLKSAPRAGSVVSVSKNDALGTTELKLSNGAMVTLKPTDFKNDQILMGATRAGGKDNYGLADKYNAEYATAIVGAMGVGEFSPTDLKKALAGKTIAVNPVFTGTSEGVRGNSTVKDLESMLQLTYLYLTEPRKDTALFKSFVQRNKSQFAMLSANPQAAFIDTMYKALYNNNPLAPVAVPKSEYYDKINLDRSLAIYRERFGDATGMNFVFVGSFKEEEIIPLIEKYIASLPATGKKFNYVDNKVRTVQGKKNLTVNKGKEQKSLILAFYAGEIPYSEDLELKTQAMSEVLNIRIIEELREKIQGIYGGGTFASLEKVPYGNYNFVLQLPCGPEKVDTLVTTVKKEFEMLAKNGPSQDYLDKVKRQWLEQNKVQMKENNTWLDQLLAYKTQGGDPKRFLEYEKYVNALTPKDVQQAANIIFEWKEPVLCRADARVACGAQYHC